MEIEYLRSEVSRLNKELEEHRASLRAKEQSVYVSYPSGNDMDIKMGEPRKHLP